MNAKIYEIFSSIQGEGPYAGVKQVFVRLFECNMHCTWCDTPGSIGDTSRHYQEMSLDDVWRQVESLRQGCHSVSLTGGEPLLQSAFLKQLAQKIRSTRMLSYLDTNGLLYKELGSVIDDVDIIAMDIKLPSSAKCSEYWFEHEEFLKVAARKEVFIKMVISSDTEEEDIDRAVRIVEDVAPQALVILQPNTYDLPRGVMAKCLAFQNHCLRQLPNVRILPQVHKFLKIP